MIEFLHPRYVLKDEVVLVYRKNSVDELQLLTWETLLLNHRIELGIFNDEITKYSSGPLYDALLTCAYLSDSSIAVYILHKKHRYE